MRRVVIVYRNFTVLTAKDWSMGGALGLFLGPLELIDQSTILVKSIWDDTLCRRSVTYYRYTTTDFPNNPGSEYVESEATSLPS